MHTRDISLYVAFIYNNDSSYVSWKKTTVQFIIRLHLYFTIQIRIKSSKPKAQN